MEEIGRITFWRAGAALAAAAVLLAGAVLLTVSQALPEASFPAPDAGSGVDADRAYADLPLSFEPNRGRMNPSVDFLARTSAGTAYLTDSGAKLSLPGRGGGAAVELRLLGAERSEPVTLRQLPGSVNDLRGDDPSRWETGIPTFESVRYPGIYPRVDLDWHGSRRALEYDFRLAPGADPKRIALRVEGAERLRLAADGDLLIEIGGRTLRQAAPVAYQPSGAGRTSVDARFELQGETVRFRLGEYDRGRPLVIDPVVLDYSTYLGGNGADAANAIAADVTGAGYVTGRTLSTDFDVSGPVEGNEADADVFVSKLNPAGDALVYSTYLGGNGSDSGNGIAVDATGAAYLVGTSKSTDLTTLAFDVNGQATIPNPIATDGPKADAFVAKLEPDGDALAYSAYLGASITTREDDFAAADEGVAIAVDPAGAAYVTGSTDGTNFPTVNEIEGDTGEEDPSSTGAGLAGPEISDAFVSKVNPAGDQLEYSTYLGGDQGDGGTGIAVDSLGAAYVTGGTSSPDFNTFDPIEGDSPGYDAFVSKLIPTGTELAYSTYLGGGDYDAAHGIAVDATGAAYVTGATKSSDFNTLNPVEGNSPGPDAFVSKLMPTGDQLSYSTYLGGARVDSANGIAVDSTGSAFLAGETDWRDFDLAGELEGDSAGTDAFVTRLGPAGNLVCSTYLGGAGYDRANALARAGPSNEVLIAGETSSADFDREGGLLEGDSTGEDAFVSKLTMGTPCPDGTEGPPGPAPAQDLRVYVMVLDGLRPTEINETLTPNLEDLKQSGTWYQQARSVYIAETLPNHAAMMTGVLPQRNGIVGNDALLVRRVDPQNTSKYRMHDPRLLDADTLTTRLEESCDVSTATVQSKLYLYNLFTGEPPSPSDPADQRIADRHWAPFSSPLFIPEPDDHVPDQGTMNEGFLPWLQTNPPTPHFAFVNLGDIDRSGHIDQFAAAAPMGLSASRQAGLADTDTLIGDFVDELKTTGAWDETVILFTSDHGFDWGTQEKDMGVADVAFAGRQDVIGNGAGAMVYARDGTDLGPPAQAIAALPGVELVATREPVAGFPTLHEMGVDHPGGGDIFAFARPGWREDSGSGNPLPGNHGHPISQHQTLFVTGGHPALDEEPQSVGGQTVYDTANHAFLPPAEGPGNLSIAPTVAALFGLGEPEGGYDGEPLREAFDPWALEPHVPCGASNPAPSISIDDVSLSEGNMGQGNANFTVSLSAPSLSEVRVDYRTSDGSAQAPADYESRGHTTLTFDPGDTQKQISVPVKGDTADEPDETFTVDLSAPVNAELAKLRGTATILDDDGPPDTDGDLVPDSADSCPTAAGPAANSGCPQTPASTGAPETCRTETLGTSANDTLTGTTGPDLFRGLLGSDRLLGLDGPDCLFGGPGNDTLSGEGGDDLLRGGDGRDNVSGGSEPDVISGGRGPDRLSGGAGDDQIRSVDAGRDRVRCGPGSDEVIANPEDLVGASCEVVGRSG